LFAYDNRRYCYCKACNAAIDLSLKIITHYGEFTGYNVKQFNKLIGKDVIVAHQLLKNDIEQHEYWLITPPLAGQNIPPAGFAEWMQWNSSAKQTENGEIPFLYTQLSELKNEITPEQYPQLRLSEKTKMLSFAKEYETDIISLFHASGDFNNRHKWMEGVKKVEEVNHYLPRVGESTIYSSSYSYSDDRIEFSETDDKKESSTNFTLEKTGDKKTRLTIDFYLKKNFMEQILFNLIRKKKTEETYNKSLQNLERLVKEMKLPS
jgi:hypothetical protein